jgi:DNA-binding NarL/FixJ family response regulator
MPDLIRVVALIQDPQFSSLLLAGLPQVQSMGLSGIFSDAQNCLNFLEQNPCHVLLLDMDDHPSHPPDLIQTLHSLQPRLEILLLTSPQSDQNAVFVALEVGANGCVVKQDINGLTSQIQVQISGGSPMHPVLARQLVCRIALALAREKAADSDFLTDREMDVLNLLSKGLKRVEISKILNISANTVTTYTRSLYRKLNAHSGSEAVRIALAKGLIKQPGTPQ